MERCQGGRSSEGGEGQGHRCRECEKEEREAQEREREKAREKAREQAEEAEREAKLRVEQEAATRNERVKAGVEVAKRKQAEREKLETERTGAAKDTLYSNMPQPDPGQDTAMNEERRRKEVTQLQKKANVSLPPEDHNKIIFLDVDGVLRPARAGGFDILSVDGAQAVHPDTSDFFPSAMQALRHIIERTGAVIVLSSEWRRNEALRQAVDDVLEAHRLRASLGVTRTDMDRELGTGDPVRSFAQRRAREITAWLREHEDEVKGWVVIDDINLAMADEDRKASTKSMGPKLVQTWPLCGLTMGNAKTAVRILNGEMINKVLVERPKAPATNPASGIATPPPRSSGTSTPIPGARH